MDNSKNMKTIRLGEVLVNEGYITEEQLGEALAKQRQHREAGEDKRLGDLLEEMGFVSEVQKLHALSKRLALPLISIEGHPVKIDAVERLPRAMADKYGLIAIDIRDGRLVVVVSDPLNYFAIEEVRQAVKMPVALGLAPIGSIKRAIEYYYSEVSTRRAVSEANLVESDAPELQDIMDDSSADEAPVVKLLNSLLVRGYQTSASDIHIEPFEKEISVRIRVDGTIVDYTKLSISIHQSLIARIKIMADLDIAEKRVPQDGHFRLLAGGIDLNIRVSLVPTVYGEKAVLRFLSTNSPIDHDTTFGMEQADYEKMLKALDSPHGIIYLTGPTGSGKTTTLYMMLAHLASRQVNISTIEDPVERNLSRVNQIQVNNAAGMTFDVGLRALLRQDPDIVMVGETRDAETASISVRAAITGHLVLSTLHTNDALSSVVRLADMGVAPFMIASSVVALVAQRLLRKICPDCAQEYAPTEDELRMLGTRDVKKLVRGRGCNKCNNTGYRGRVAIHEIVIIDKTLRGMISNEASTDEMLQYARTQQGMKTLREAATELVIKGVSTTPELLKTAFYEGM